MNEVTGWSGMSCTSGCPTPGAHSSWGECLRAKRTRVVWANSAAGADLTREKSWQRNLDEYSQLRSEGVQPRGTSPAAVREARELADSSGVAVDFSSPTLGLTK